MAGDCKPDSVGSLSRICNHLSNASTLSLGKRVNGSFESCSEEDCLPEVLRNLCGRFTSAIGGNRHCCSNWQFPALGYPRHSASCCLDFPPRHSKMSWRLLPLQPLSILPLTRKSNDFGGMGLLSGCKRLYQRETSALLKLLRQPQTTLIR